MTNPSLSRHVQAPRESGGKVKAIKSTISDHCSGEGMSHIRRGNQLCEPCFRVALDAAAEQLFNVQKQTCHSPNDLRSATICYCQVPVLIGSALASRC